MISKIGFFLLFPFLFLSCFSNPVLIEQNQRIEIGSVSSPAYARECGTVFLFFIPIHINDRYTRAYSKLLEQAKDGILTEIRIQESWYYQFLGTKYCTTFTAQVIRGIPK
ncbi:hypothetical protein JWG44_14055 [Leptospira sp. 201903071]|uniref:hypothetical protein n=1 Tax=Leptospira ainazelensis TaxID=2810034 RepID=UPI00196550FA|nr:hypothetical protein [Leptospira ainazelensis]MBM9501376.1 hypothetical protein [Leptospira ainazelensis]